MGDGSISVNRGCKPLSECPVAAMGGNEDCVTPEGAPAELHCLSCDYYTTVPGTETAWYRCQSTGETTILQYRALRPRGTGVRVQVRLLYYSTGH